MFNKNQLKAICHHKGPAIVLAGPGSGKTTVITGRVKKLIENKVSPHKILVVTFTRAAAVNMQRKFFSLMDREDRARKNYPVTFGTFHSVYFKILKIEKGYKSDCIISEREKADIFKEIIIRKNISVRNISDFIQNLSGEISNVKGNMICLETYSPKCCNKDEFLCIYEEYEKAIAAEGKIDFDDMLLKCYNIFIHNEQVKEKWQQMYDYILIDEFQDINQVQYQVIKMLAQPDNNIFIVGDDDQSIYGFRGACPELMFQFKEDYKEAAEIYLDINYRCTMSIVEVADRLISNNNKRFPKCVRALDSGKIKPDIRKFKTQYDQLSYLKNKIIECRENGICLENIAVLVRNNGQINNVKKFLKNHSVDVKAGIGITLYAGQVGIDILNYAKAALDMDKNISDNPALVSIINKPARYVNRQILGHDGMNLSKLKKIYNHSRDICNGISKLEMDLKMIKKLNPSAAVMYILKGAGYENYIRQYALEKNIKVSALLEQIEEIRSDCSVYNTLKEWIDTVNHTNGKERREYELNSTNSKAKKDDAVNIMTMHSSKGLEFEAVFIIDVNQGIIPTSKAVLEKDFEEERRVMYVAVTRAKKILGVYAVMESLGCKIEESIFIKEMAG